MGGLSGGAKQTGGGTYLSGRCHKKRANPTLTPDEARQNSLAVLFLFTAAQVENHSNNTPSFDPKINTSHFAWNVRISTCQATLFSCDSFRFPSCIVVDAIS